MSFRSFLKAGVKRGISMPGVRAPFRRMMRDSALIFMLHRFQDEQNEVSGLDSAVLRRTLKHLRKENVRLLSLNQLVDAIEMGDPLDGAVVFTMDDGYREQGTIGGPIFAEFDCPVTLFLTTGFIDRELWLWWDKVEYIFANSRRAGAKLDQRDFLQRCKNVSEEKRMTLIADLAAQAEVALPGAAPSRYQPLGWDAIRSLEGNGMTFAPHSVSHPILSRETAERSAAEIEGSWKRLKEELSSPVPVFGYPNGQAQDFGEREFSIMKGVGLRAAVTAERGYAGSSPDDLFNLPRLVLPEDEASLTALLGGIEHLRAARR
jgi:peptidoglycan/xylan/chitin deacetylase (PgdA/CDA1 family)